MTIVAVDNYGQRLMELTASLGELFPDDEILFFTDPLLALKHIYNHAVDIVFTRSRTRPIDGCELSRIVREQDKNTLVYCLTDTASHAEGRCISACMTGPLTADAIRGILQTA